MSMYPHSTDSSRCNKNGTKKK